MSDLKGGEPVITVVNPFEKAVVTIYSLNGTTVLQQEIPMGNQTIDINQLASGVYLIDNRADGSTNPKMVKLVVL